MKPRDTRRHEREKRPRRHPRHSPEDGQQNGLGQKEEEDLAAPGAEGAVDPHLAAALAQLARKDMTGVLHVAGEGEPGSWADLARATLRAAGLTTRVRNVDTAAYLQRGGARAAPRPANGVLSLEKARREGVQLGDWRTSLLEYVGELL